MAIGTAHTTGRTMQIDWNNINVGDKVAIEHGSSYSTFTFCTVSRVTKTQVEVTIDNLSTKPPVKFSRTTARMLGGETWDKGKRLVTAEAAHSAIARRKAREEAQAERYSIRQELSAVGSEFWDASSLEKIDALKQRIAAWIDLNVN